MSEVPLHENHAHGLLFKPQHQFIDFEKASWGVRARDFYEHRHGLFVSMVSGCAGSKKGLSLSEEAWAPRREDHLGAARAHLSSRF